MKTPDPAKEYEAAWAEGDAPVKTAVLGSGMLNSAAKAMNGRAYKLHLEESKAAGDKPMTAEEFAKQQGGKA